jgi:hypothetical protein
MKTAIPPDPNPKTCLLVREIIEDFESDYIGHGFETGLFNLVGALKE